MITLEQKQQFGDILEELGLALDITEAQYNSAVESYEAVGHLLSKEDSPLAPYEPEILPQGSFLFGTVIKPIDDDIDIDLVCRIVGKKPDWTQYDIKNVVGEILKKDGSYQKMLEKEKQRCWTLKYYDSRNFHMDILPSIVSHDYKIVLEKSLRSFAYEDIDNLAIRITDKEEENYYNETDPDEWPKSNPFGYAKWLQNQANLTLRKSALLMEEKLQPVPTYNKEKLPLIRAVQILKRHRDIMFKGRDNKPISIIITTLAGKAYGKEENLAEALLNIINKMPSFIEERYVEQYGREIKWISNPVNEEENFADKWPDETEKEANFYEWLDKVCKDINQAVTQTGGLPYVSAALKSPFGESVVVEAFKNYGKRSRLIRESGNLKMASGTGTLGSIGTTVKNHHNYGNEEN